MGLRLVGKSIVLAMRSRGRFIAFTMMYTVLMLWMSINWENRDTAQIYLVYAILSTVILSILYAWIIINYRRKEIATLKCIGYTNANIRTIIIGELVWVTSVAFVIVAEFLIHYAAAMNYYFYQNTSSLGITSISDYRDNTQPFLQIPTVFITLAIFLASQIIGILIMYSKILKLRPIVALRVLK
jgi:ABC-type antimicrobial peptide transport system permease subunit